MVKVELEIPRNVYEALQAIGESCHTTVREILQWGARGEVESFINSPGAFTDHFINPLIERVQVLLEAE